MRPPTAKRSLGVYAALGVLALGVSGWQWQEHQRFQRAAAQALINRGRDITSTLGIVVSSQRRFGNLVAKDRIESALNGLITPGELESIAILGATGETIAGAGRPVELTPEMMRARGVYWRDHELTLMNLMDLGTGGATEENSLPAALVVSNARMSRAFRPPNPRNAPAARAPEAAAPAGPTSGAPASATEPAAVGAATGTGGVPANSPGASSSGTSIASNATPTVANQRFPYSRPSWMDREEYDALIKKQGVHSLVISLSTDEMRRAVNNDLLLRSLVSLLACGAAVLSGLAWRNVSRNSELQIRLVKAGEMNSHLAEMNFAAAGLAHETRNPLNLIRGFAQMIAIEPGVAPKLKQHASTIIEEADRVTVQLNEFIDYSKPREAHLAPVDVTRVIADVARTLLPDIEDKQIKLTYPEAPLMIEADEQLFRQALFNLLLNAVQAVGTHGIIEVRWHPAADGEVVLELADNGPGVAPTDRANIFKPYVTMRPKGVGLGLAIVQQIVSAHRWAIVCEANEPQGALFRILHLKPASARHEA